MTFQKRGRIKKETKWIWQGEPIEEVREYKYLGYVFQKSNGIDAQIKAIKRKAMRVMGRIWSIGNQKFENNFNLRYTLFRAIVKAIITYGAEIWGWKEVNDLEVLQTKYIRWVLKLDSKTPNYITLTETNKYRLRTDFIRRAIEYEERTSRAAEETYIKQIWKEIEEGRGSIRLESQRRKVYEEAGYSLSEVYRLRKSYKLTNTVIDRLKEVELQQRYNKIQSNNIFKRLAVYGETARYLRERKERGEQSIIARFRCGNEAKAEKKWSKEEKTCRICKQDQETMIHLVRDCRKLKEINKIGWKVLSDTGEGVTWMKEVIKRREANE